MQPSSQQPVTRPLDNPATLDTYIAHTTYAPSSTQQLTTLPDPQPFPALHTPTTTQQLPQLPQLPTPTTTKLPTLNTMHLPISGPLTTTKLPTVIPATQKRRRRTTITRVPRRRRAALVSTIVASLTIVLFVAFFVNPLDNGQRQQGIVQALGNIISTRAFGSIDPAQHIAPPVPSTAPPNSTPVLVNKGYCGGTDIWGACAPDATASGVTGTGIMQRPINGTIITQVFAHPEYQAWCGCWKPHTGIDLAADYGTPIMAADSGEVIWVGWDWSGLGWAVKINHGHSLTTIYGHMATYLVKVGDSVTKGQIIGREGSTGASTGPHLHFMVLVNNIWVNPTDYVALP